MHRSPQQSLAIGFALAFALLLGSCATTSTLVSPSKTEKVIDVPFVRQDDKYACGLVALQSLCGFWHVSIDDATHTRLASAAQEQSGLSGDELRDELERLGFETFLFSGTLDHSATGLLHQIDVGRPPLLMLSLTPEHRHYVLLVGYDEVERRVSLLDPAHGRVQMPYESFEKSWAATEYFTVLAIPRAPIVTTIQKAE